MAFDHSITDHRDFPQNNFGVFKRDLFGKLLFDPESEYPFEDIKDPTGFTDTSITVTYNKINRTVTLSGNVKAFYNGKVISQLIDGWVSDPHIEAPTTNLYLYYNGKTILWTSDLWGSNHLQICAVSYDSNGNFFGAFRECHGVNMPYSVHEHLHYSIGTRLLNGGDLTNYVLDSFSPTNRRPLISETALKDEDLKTTNLLFDSADLTNNQYRLIRLDGASATMLAPTQSSEICFLSGSTPRFNTFSGGNWILNDVSNNNYMSLWVIATPACADTDSQKLRYLILTGQSQGTLESQQSLTVNNLNLGNLSGLFNEFIFIAKIIIRFTSGDWKIQQIEKITGSRISQTNILSGNFLSTVTTNTSLTGLGTVTTPLGLTGNTLSIHNLANANGWLKNDGSGNFSYSTPTAAQVGAIAGSGTAGTIPKFATGTTLSDSIIKESSSCVSIFGNVDPSTRLKVYGKIFGTDIQLQSNNSSQFEIENLSSGWDIYFLRYKVAGLDKFTIRDVDASNVTYFTSYRATFNINASGVINLNGTEVNMYSQIYPYYKHFGFTSYGQTYFWNRDYLFQSDLVGIPLKLWSTRQNGGTYSDTFLTLDKGFKSGDSTKPNHAWWLSHKDSDNSFRIGYTLNDFYSDNPYLSINSSGLITINNNLIISGLSASLPVFTNASKQLVNNTVSGTGNVLMSSNASADFSSLQVGGVAVVTLSGTQTLTNKTLSSPILTGTVGGSPIMDFTNVTIGGVQVPTVSSVSTLTNKSISASQITAGTFGAGDYTFPNNLIVNGVISSNLGSVKAYNATGQGTYIELAKYNGSLSGVPGYYPTIKTDFNAIYFDASSRFLGVISEEIGYNAFWLRNQANSNYDVRLATDGQDCYIRTGKFGIGKEFPAQALDVVGNIYSSQYIVSQGGVVQSSSFDNTNGTFIELNKLQNDVPGITGYYPSLKTNNNLLCITTAATPNGAYRFWGTFGTGGGSNYLEIRKDNNPAANGVVLRSNGDSWMDGGNFGIGTSSPLFRLDSRVSGNMQASFGNNNGGNIYVIAEDPNIGFNLYFSSSWKYGKGSVGKYGGNIGLSTSNGKFYFEITSAAGNADASVTPIRAMEIYSSNIVDIKNKLTIQDDLVLYKSSGTNYISCNSSGTLEIISGGTLRTYSNGANDFKFGNSSFPATLSGSNGDMTVPGKLKTNGNEFFDYDEGSFTISWGGFSAGGSSTVYFTRVGKKVTLHFASFGGTSNSSEFYANAGAIPSGLRPRSKYFIPATPNTAGLDLTVSTICGEINTDGSLDLGVFYGDAYDLNFWDSSGNKGIGNSFSVTYITT